MSKFRIVTLSIMSLVIICVIVILIILSAITADAKLDDAKLRNEVANIEVLDINNNNVNDGKNNYVVFNDISSNITKSFIALEDKRFYSHNGLDYRRIAGAIINNMKAGKFKEGASTISQQLIKNTHLTSEKTIIRKLNEAKLAKLLEKKYSKDEILEMYLNVIYFGSGIYGISDASRAFFDKSARDINISEAAILAGVVKNPKAYSPRYKYDDSIKRRNVVLDVLLKNKMLSEKECLDAKNCNIVIQNGLIETTYDKSYYQEVLNEAVTITGLSEKELINSGYTICTYMEPIAQSLVYNRVTSTDFNPYNANSLSIMLDNNSGGIKAYHSNLSLPLSGITAIAGSVLKPFSVYAPAIEQGIISPATKVLDEATNFNGYSPQNYNNIYHGYVTARESLAHSYNIPAVKILNDIGIYSAVNMLNKFNIRTKENDENLSLALGSLSVSPMAITSAYSALARGGEYCSGRFIRSISNKKDRLIYTHDSDSRRIIGEDTSYLLTNMLISSVQEGTCQKLKYLPYQVAAKSGTVSATDKLTRDAWVAAYTASDTFLSWHGAKNKDYLPQDYGGGGYPATIIQSIMREYYSSSLPPDFSIPSTVKFFPIDHSAYTERHTIELGSDVGRGDIFSSFHPPQPSKSTSTEELKSLLPQLSIIKNADFNEIVITQLHIGREYTIQRRYGIFGKSIVISRFTAVSSTHNITDVLKNSGFWIPKYSITFV